MKVVEQPASEDVVQVLMSEEMARRFEEACLEFHTKGYTKLSPPVQFGEDDVPTYIIQVGETEDAER